MALGCSLGIAFGSVVDNGDERGEIHVQCTGRGSALSWQFRVILVSHESVMGVPRACTIPRGQNLMGLITSLFRTGDPSNLQHMSFFTCWPLVDLKYWCSMLWR